MKEQNEEETEKINLFQKDILKENEFLKKLKDIFKLQHTEKFQEILILQKHKFIDQVEKEVLYILKKIYSEKIISNRKFNSLFQLAKEDFISIYNSNLDEISLDWEYFNELKENIDIEEDILDSYYLTDFRKHCHNHEGQAIHKCGHGDKGKFIKLSSRQNNRYRNSKEFKYIVCEECKKVFQKDFFNSYCPHCKENYLSSIIGPNENKEYFIPTYTNPHCESFINKTIPCKLCKEKLYYFINDKKIKCLKCNYVIDLNSRNDLQWQCSKCNKYFKSGIKIFNPCESSILTKILKKALLLKIKAKPQFMNCCDIDINNSPFFHKKECKGILYLCNVENYFLKNKKWVIVCDKCHAINNCKNFIWTCPKCGKRTRETNNDYEAAIKSPARKISSSHNNINRIEDEYNHNNNIYNSNNKDSKPNIFQKYLSNYIAKKPSISSCSNDENNKRKKNRYDNIKEIYSNKKGNENYEDIEFQSENEIIKVNVKNNEKPNISTNNSINSNSKYIIRSTKRNNQRQNQLSTTNSTCNINYINTPNKFKNSKDKIYIKKNLNSGEDNYYNNNENNKLVTKPLQRIELVKKKNSMFSSIKEEEKNMPQRYKDKRGDSYKAGSVIDETEERINETFNLEYFSQQKNYEENLNNVNKRNLAFNLQNKRNIPVRLRYNNNNNDNNMNYNNYNKNRQRFKKSVEINESNNKIRQENDKNEDDSIDKNKRYIYNNVEDKILNGDGRFSKETTTHESKGSMTSSSKDTNNNNIINARKDDNSNKSNNSKDQEIFYSTSNNFNFKNKRKQYISGKERIKDNNDKNIKNLKNNLPNQDKYKNCKTILELNDMESNYNKKLEDIPDDVIEPSEIDYSEDIPIYDYKIKQNKELYDNIQNGIKKILENGKLPQFNIDNYTIGKKIGDGAFGVLFSVVNNKTKKKYALKKLTAHDLKLLEEFHREFEIAYKINHENILSLYGICIRIYDSTTFALFVLMDLAECDWEVEINKRFKEKRYYSEEELISILKQLTRALVYLQNKQIAHRDIKPENILLFHDNDEITYKICDFGEAKEKIKVNSRHKSIRGTDFYMSPILFKGLTQEEKFVRDNPYKSDVFSLGYCMIIACVLDFNFINKIRNIEEQTKIDRIIRESLENRYSFKFIHVLQKMTVYFEKERIDFLGLEQLIKDEL